MFFIKTNREARGRTQQAVIACDDRNGKTKDDDTFGFHHMSNSGEEQEEKLLLTVDYARYSREDADCTLQGISSSFCGVQQV